LGQGILAEITQAVARAYLTGLREKAVSLERLRVSDGSFILAAGLAARRLRQALADLQGKITAEDILFKSMQHHLADAAQRGGNTLAAEVQATGPDDPFAFLRDLTAAMEAAAENFMPLPGKDDDLWEAYSKAENTMRRVDRPSLHANHALQCAARALAPAWCTHTEHPFTRGAYNSKRRNYGSPALLALHSTLRRLDPDLLQSSVGTALDSVRKERKREADSDSPT